MNVLSTGALMEIIRGNPKYAQLINTPFYITDYTLAEFYIGVMNETDEEKARYWYKKLLFYTKQASIDLIIKALKYVKTANAKEFASISYIFARENNYQFVTGDKEFEKLPGVMFIKK
jgi:hypothetical protein